MGEGDLYREICDTCPVPFSFARAIRDSSGAMRDLEVRFQNEAATAIARVAPGQAPVPGSFAALFPGFARDRHWQAYESVLVTGSPWRETIRCQELAGRWYRVTATRPRAEHLLLTYEDLTDAKEGELAQREAAETNETLFRVAQTISDLNLEKIVQAVTDEATRAVRAEFGAFFYNVRDSKGESYTLYTLSGVPKETFSRFPMPRNTKLFGPTFRGESTVRIDDVLRDPRYGQNPPYRGMPHGHLPVRSYLAVPVVSRTGEVLGGLFFGHSQPGVFIARDERLVAAIAKQTAVAMDNTRLLEIAQRESAVAEAASRTKDEFLATISHELRTPLSAILGWTHVLRTGTPLDARGRRAVEVIERNANAQAMLIGDVLDVSRIVTGKLRLNIGTVWLSEVLSAAIDSVRPAAAAKNIELLVHTSPEVSCVSGDASRLQQVVWNLLSNAVKFTPQDGRVSVRLERRAALMEIVVADTGRGIAPDFIDHVFERFRQADASTTRAYGGLGLGLAIVKSIVEMHGGTVAAESGGVDRGATFTVRIPAVAPQTGAVGVAPLPSASPKAAPGSPQSLKGLTVLAVDDEPDARELMRVLLEQGEARVLLAGSSAEAIDILKDVRPDVLVSDIGMPGEDGYALIEKLRALPPDRGGRTPAIALTAYASKEDRTRALQRGYDQHLSKPVDALELLIVIVRLAERFLAPPT